MNPSQTGIGRSPQLGRDERTAWSERSRHGIPRGQRRLTDGQNSEATQAPVRPAGPRRGRTAPCHDVRGGDTDVTPASRLAHPTTPPPTDRRVGTAPRPWQPDRTPSPAASDSPSRRTSARGTTISERHTSEPAQLGRGGSVLLMALYPPRGADSTPSPPSLGETRRVRLRIRAADWCVARQTLTCRRSSFPSSRGSDRTSGQDSEARTRVPERRSGTALAGL